MSKKSSKKATPLTLTEGEQLLGWVYLAIDFLVLPIAIAILGAQFGGFSDSVANFIYYLTNAVCCALIFRKLLKDSLIQAGSRFGKLLGVALTGFLLLLGANQLMTGVCEALIPEFVNLNNAAIAAMVRESPVLMTVGTVLLVPIAEECLFRGLLFLGPVKKNRYGAYALSVLAFAAIHVMGYVGEVDGLTLALCFLQYVPAGLVLAWACESSNSLFASMLIHAAINAGSVILVK